MILLKWCLSHKKIQYTSESYKKDNRKANLVWLSQSDSDIKIVPFSQNQLPCSSRQVKCCSK